MNFERSAGILLHPTSLPGKFGIGDLGYEAYNFINFLADMGQTLWQVFPLGPTGYGDSPYQCFSAFAGNPLLISPDLLKEEGYLNEEDLYYANYVNPLAVDFGMVITEKNNLLNKAFNQFKQNQKKHSIELNEFIEENKIWLEDYALFMALKEYHNGEVWSKWDKHLIQREKNALKEWSEKLFDRINFQKFVQFIFFKQWKSVKDYANKKGIKIIGDLPLFIAYDSADLWSNKKLFTVDKEGKLQTVAGVPPDYFSETGQLWGNPLYRWKEMEKDDFKWWRDRIETMLKMVDIIRIDHFRGLDAYWEIPGDALTAEKGKWVKAPGEKLFQTLIKYLGDIPIIAEDLGLITKSVVELREKFNLPGMKILQFAFGTGMERKFLPHNFIPGCVVYTGSHDNNTTRGYFEQEKNNGTDIYEFTQKYLNYFEEDICSALIRTAYSSAANVVIIPMQDVLNLGSEARMNFPGKPYGNWTWRFSWEQVPSHLPAYYKELCKLYERPPQQVIDEEIEQEESKEK